VSIPPSSEPISSNSPLFPPYQPQQQNFVPSATAAPAPAVTNAEPPMFMPFNPTSAGPAGPQFPQMTPVSAPMAAPVPVAAPAPVTAPAPVAAPVALEPANIAQQENFAPAQPRTQNQFEQQNGFNYSNQEPHYPSQTPQQGFNQAPPHHQVAQPVAPVQQETQQFQAPVPQTQPHFQPTYTQFNPIPENSAPLSQAGVMPAAPVLPAAPTMPEPTMPEMPTFQPPSSGNMPPMPKQPSSVEPQFTPAQQQPTSQPVQNEQPQKAEPQKAPSSKANTSASGPSRSFLGSVFRKVLPNSLTGEAYLPDDTNKSLVWDEDKKKWVDLSGGAEENSAPPPPPPTMPMMQNTNQMPIGSTGAMSGSMNPMGGAMPNGGAPPAPASNFRRGNKKGRNMYKDAKALGETVSVSNKMMPDTASAPSGVPNPGFFMPQPTPNDGTNGNSAGDERQGAPTQQNGQSAQAANQGGPPAGPGPIFFNPSQFGQGQAPFVPPGSS